MLFKSIKFTKDSSSVQDKERNEYEYIDFLVNDPVDDQGRPLKINSFFKSKENQGFSEAIKRMHRDLG